MPPKRIQKKKKTQKNKKLNKVGRMVEKQVFDWTNMPHFFNKKESTLLIAGGYEGARNDTYHRWYPDRVTDKKIGKYEHFETEKDWAAGKLLNNWLLKHGMIIKDEFYFHVLIHISW